MYSSSAAGTIPSALALPPDLLARGVAAGDRVQHGAPRRTEDAFTFSAGISDAASREAQRALATGDTARAKALARAIVQAWEVADVDVPAMAPMGAILKAAVRR